MDGAVWRRAGKNYETGKPAGVDHRIILWESGTSGGDAFVEHAVTDCVFVSEVDCAAEENAAGAEAETVGVGASGK